MALNLDGIVIDRVIRGTYATTAGELVATLVDISNATINTSSESKDKTDANGVLIKRFFTAKTVEFSGEVNLLSMRLMALQHGTEVEVAAPGATITLPMDDYLIIDGVAATVDLHETPATAPTKAYEIINGGSIGRVFTKANSASATAFALSGKVLTPPTGFTGDLVLRYDYASDSASVVTASANGFPSTGQLKLDITVLDVCDQDTTYLAHLWFPSFQLSPDSDLTLDTDSTQPFSGTAQVAYCSNQKTLFKFWIDEDDTYEN